MSEKRFKFNVIDVVVIILIIAAVAGVALRYNLKRFVGIGRSEAVITFEVLSIRTNIANDMLVEGQKYYCDKLSAEIGSFYDVENFKINPHKEFFENESGEPIASDYDKRVDIIGYILSEGDFDDEGVFFCQGKNRINPGDELTIYSTGRTMTINVLTIEKKG